MAILLKKILLNKVLQLAVQQVGHTSITSITVMNNNGLSAEPWCRPLRSLVSRLPSRDVGSTSRQVYVRSLLPRPWARIHESVITYDGHIYRPGITELELGPSENSYSCARKRSVIVVLEVGGFHTGCLVTKRCTAHGRRVICPARQSSGE